MNIYIYLKYNPLGAISPQFDIGEFGGIAFGIVIWGYISGNRIP